MKKYKLENAILTQEEKTFIGKDNSVIPYQEYCVLLTINNNAVQIKIDKNDKKALNTLIECGLIEEIK